MPGSHRRAGRRGPGADLKLAAYHVVDDGHVDVVEKGDAGQDEDATRHIGGLAGGHSPGPEPARQIKDGDQNTEREDGEDAEEGLETEELAVGDQLQGQRETVM